MKKRGIKETLEVFSLIICIAKFIYKEIKGDGLEFSDIGKLMLDDKFQKGLVAAVTGITIVPKELKNMTVFDGFNTTRFLLDSVEEILLIGSDSEEIIMDDVDEKTA